MTAVADPAKKPTITNEARHPGWAKGTKKSKGAPMRIDTQMIRAEPTARPSRPASTPPSIPPRAPMVKNTPTKVAPRWSVCTTK